MSLNNCYVLILDDHLSHVTMDVVCKSKKVSHYLLMLLSHCSHAMQPLDVGMFGRFKLAFRVYKDVSPIKNKGHGA